ncbi:MAG: N-acetyltransferase family protein [Actinomycetota bacterium]
MTLPPPVRAARLSDAERIAEIYEPVVRSTAISFETEPPQADDMRRRMRETLPLYPWLAHDPGERVDGYGYAAAHHERPAYLWTVEVSLYVDAESRGAGVGRRIALGLLEVLRAQGFVNAIASIALPNAASVALFESLGFTPVGVDRAIGYKLGWWRDVGRWRCRLAEPRADPAPPVPFERLVVEET